MKKILMTLIIVLFVTNNTSAYYDNESFKCDILKENIVDTTYLDYGEYLEIDKNTTYHYVSYKDMKQVVSHDFEGYGIIHDDILFDDIYWIITTPDGSNIAYYGENEGVKILVVNGKIYNTFTNIEDFKFSPDGKNFAFKTKDEKGIYKLVKNGEIYADDNYNNIIKFYFSEDSNHLFYMWDKYIQDKYKYGTFIDKEEFEKSKYKNMLFYIDYSALEHGWSIDYEPNNYFKYDKKEEIFKPVTNNLLNINGINFYRFSNSYSQNQTETNKIYSNDNKSYFKLIQDKDEQDNLTYSHDYLNLKTYLEKDGKKYDLGKNLSYIYKPGFLNNNKDISYIISNGHDYFGVLLKEFSKTSDNGLNFYINDNYINFDDIYYKENFGDNGVKLVVRKGSSIQEIVCNVNGTQNDNIVSFDKKYQITNKNEAMKNLIISSNKLSKLNGGEKLKNKLDKISDDKLLNLENKILELSDKSKNSKTNTILEYLYNKIIYLNLNN